jgi:1-acyl-sn-glycerol-3-phosphate acyltransferase
MSPLCPVERFNEGDKIIIIKAILDMYGLKSIISPEDEKRIDEIFEILREHYKNYNDPWGFSIGKVEKTLRVLLPIYRSYFNVKVHDIENIPDEPLLVVSNHTGQLPIDGMLVTIAFLMEAKKPRVLRAMVERFMVQIPFLAEFAAQSGSIVGDRANCQFLLEQKESILIFPEGVKGISKNTNHYYEVQPFTLGFYKIALQSQTNILPICVIGAEDMFPFVYHPRGLAAKLGLPALPLSLNLFPLPSPIDIYIGKVIEVSKTINPEAPDKDLKEPVYKIEEEIKKMVAHGLQNKRTLKQRVLEFIK